MLTQKISDIIFIERNSKKCVNAYFVTASGGTTAEPVPDVPL
jgi:hypothetical protein